MKIELHPPAHQLRYENALMNGRGCCLVFYAGALGLAGFVGLIAWLVIA